MAATSNISIADLFKKLNSALRSFASELGEVIAVHNRQAPMNEIRTIMQDIKSRATTDPKQKAENEELLKLLNQLTVDKNVLALVKLESEEWLEFLDSIERRLEMNKDTLTKGELKTYEQIKEATSEMREILRKEE